MSKPNHPQKTPLAAAVAGAMAFAGFEDWFEVFTTGEQTDSQGRTQTFTEADLDSIVANHSADEAAPLVVGHPKTNDPAYGWTDQLKREGNTLFAKARNVAAEFETAVRNQHFPKRSISIVPDGSGGYRLRHIGFLGAVPPAVKGLADIAFSETHETLVFEYSLAEATERTAWGLASIGRILRGLRDWIIEDKGLEKANELIPDYAIEGVQRDAQQAQAELDNPQSYSSHNKNDSQESDMKKFSQEDLDAAVQAAKDEANQQHQQVMNHSARQAEASDLIKDAVSRGALLPAQVPGLAEFMAGLNAEAEQAFEFSASEGTDPVKKTPYDYMCDLVKALGPQVKTGRDNREEADKTTRTYSAPAGYTVDPEKADLHQRALEYAEQHNCDYVVAVQKLEKE